ncbi:macrophage mannose receptor 1-like [Plakobranchus ocellatus]|uniref:Macrophage mannose receptor 1-like n=1 Tax=Plakobranchus ocellatus TaxID=259542 RepID=A0AAV4E0B0_9GAST|nr:macrophage mannose receptor 1-like [Plakobranchus ocellatus]
MFHFIIYVVANAFITITAVQVQCPDGFRLFEGSCYYLGDAGYDFRSGEYVCGRKDSELVKVSSPEENAFIKSLLQDDDAIGAWIGVVKVKDFWLYPFTFKPLLFHDLPKGTTGTGSFTFDYSLLRERFKKCAALSNQRAWAWEGMDCDDRPGMKFVCKAWSFAKACTSRVCYGLFSTKKLQWHAQLECEHLGGALASIRSEEESKAVKAYLAQFSKSAVWTAGSDRDTEDEWYWQLDSEKVKISDDLTDWADSNNKGNGRDCILMAPPEWKWYDVDCLEDHTFLCEFPNVNPITG